MQLVQNMLTQQRKRLVGTLMNYFERTIYEGISPAQQTELRGVVLSAVSAYHDVCLDLLKASVADGTVINDEALRMIGQMHTDMQAIRREIGHAESV